MSNLNGQQDGYKFKVEFELGASRSYVRDYAGDIVTQDQAEDKDDENHYRWTPQRVWQAIAKWWEGIGGSYGKGLLDTETIEDAKELLEVDQLTNDLQTKADIVPNDEPTEAQILIGNTSGSYEPKNISKDATIAADGQLTLAGSGVKAGTYTKVTVDKKGRTTKGENPTTLEGYGITDAAPKNTTLDDEAESTDNLPTADTELTSLLQKARNVIKYLLEHYTPKERKISAGTGLAGGGSLEADRTIRLDASTLASLALADGALLKENNLSDLDSLAATLNNLGLNNVDNTSDTDKPVSTAQASAISSAKSEAISSANQYADAGLLLKVDKVAGKGLSDTNFSQAEKDKLARLESSKYKGQYTSLADLQNNVNNPTAGDYADVDLGLGSSVVRYIYDASDSEWVEQVGTSTQLTGAQVKQMYEAQLDTNAYTDSEKSKLAGIATGATNNIGTLADKDSVGTDEIDNNAATNAKLAQVPSKTIKGRTSAGVGDVEDLNPAQAREVLELGGAATKNVDDLIDNDLELGGDTPKEFVAPSQLAVKVAINRAAVNPPNLKEFASFTYDRNTDTYLDTSNARATEVHEAMRRCVVLDDGTINYFLDKDDSTLKEDGTPANLDGTDGQVMVYIPKYYAMRYDDGNGIETYSMATKATWGLPIHPAFILNGVEKDYLLVGAYDAVVFSDALGEFIDGLNLDDNRSRVDLTKDLLGSVSGKYAMAGLTRAEFRQVARNRGEGWCQWDYLTWQAIVFLLITEYGNLNSQDAVGNGNTSKSYPSSSAEQSDSPHTVNGITNHLGNNSGGLGDDYVSYRGLEHLWAQVYQWVDGCMISDYQLYITDDPEKYADSITNMDALGDLLPTLSSGYISKFQDIQSPLMLVGEVGGNSVRYVGDHYFIHTGNRVVSVGGAASRGADSGASLFSGRDAASFRDRDRGSRLMFKK